MSDRRRIVTISPTGTVTTVKDLEDITTYYAERDTFQVVPSSRQTVWAQRQRRYGGARAVAESHGNGAISWRAIVKGSTVDQVAANVESVIGILESPRFENLFLEWRPDAASSSVYWDIRGPSTWTPTYSWVLLNGTKAMRVDFSVPVGPLGQSDPTTISVASTALPSVVSLGTAIPGDAPALADVTLRTSTAGAAPIWALIGWTQRPGSPLSGSVAPFGVIEAETATGLSTWASFTGDATYGGGAGIRATTSGFGTASASWVVDPSVMVSDDFSAGQIDVEAWARVALDAGVVSPKLTLSLEPNAGTAFGLPVYSAEYGSAGKVLTRPSSGTAFRPTRLGTLSMPVDAYSPLKWNVKVAGSWAVGSTGVFGLDRLLMVPARARALSPTGKPNDASYPAFISTTADTSKTIRGRDLSGRVASAAGNSGRDSGLGGSPIELPPGNVDLLLKLSSLVPDDPSSDSTTEQLSHTVTGQVLVWPRYWLARGA
jgi:hypothetical protein